jgi:hypothetical protein
MITFVIVIVNKNLFTFFGLMDNKIGLRAQLEGLGVGFGQKIAAASTLCER